MPLERSYKNSRILVAGSAGFVARQRQPDLSRAKALPDWEPKVALDDGLKETIADFKRTLELS